ncbi:heavy metal translocating P-type ATPase [Numidum massiliense]|uniref:heavy metal translocating P-type ATPase n=1 Tax=Numidum massiliense TaxID=1522315 RepID=UPI0006D55CB2|nr:cation-translocating P-type ATPase [Numidum massiliense]
MRDYKLVGLSCPNCAADLQEQINELPGGESASISYQLGKLTVDEATDLDKVQKILATDGVRLETSAAQGDTAASRRWQWTKHLPTEVIASAVIFIVALSFGGYAYVAIPLYLAAIILSGRQTFIKGLKNLVRFKFNIDTLMTIALIGAVCIGEWKEATMVAILFGLNEHLEGLGMEKARDSVEKLLAVAPKEALLIDGDGERIVPIASLQVGDIVRVRPGDQVPSDGFVIEGKSSVNEAAITGESLPVDKQNGDNVFGGSVNNEGVLKVKVGKPYEDSALAKILHLVEQAQETKTPTELFINRFAQYYTPLIIVIAIVVMTVPPLLFGGTWGDWFYQGLAVLIVGCPCALILSSPIANIAGITRNARNGILVKGSVYLEQLGKIDTLAFDKTGTLTKGTPHVAKKITYDHERFLAVAGAVEKSSAHPLAQAIMQEVAREMAPGGVPLSEPDDSEAIPGQGVQATIDGEIYTVGNEKSIAHIAVPANVQRDIEQMKAEGLTLVLVADSAHVLGIFGIADEIRAESREVIDALHRAGVHQTVMLTGDHEKTAEKVAQAVGVDASYGNLLPEDKVEKIKALAGKGEVAMVGDGINDAPALATADLGIAMGKGTDSAIETADVVLMQDHLGKLPSAIAVAKRVNRTIRFNIAFALGLKLLALLLTIPGLLTLWIAIISDMGATVLVTLFSLTILWERKSDSVRVTG